MSEKKGDSIPIPENSQFRETGDWIFEQAGFKPTSSKRTEILNHESTSESPSALKASIALKLGRSVRGLNNFVSEWRKQYKKDLPWVIRVPGLSWVPDMKAFETWMKTYSGKEATRRKK